MKTQAPAKSSWPTNPPVSAEHAGTRITLSWSDGSTRPVNTTWLRDNCLCDECRIVQTGEHRYFLGLHDNTPEPATVTLDDDTLAVEWIDGHITRYSSEAFARITAIAERDHPPHELWADDFTPERFDYRDVLNDESVRIAFMEQFMRDGLVLISETPTESGECIRFLEALGIPVTDTPFDRLHDVFFHSDGYNVAHTDEPLPLHNDFASYKWPPSGQLLHMLVNDVTGGEWVNGDGFKILAQLAASDPEAIDVLATVPVAFREHSDTAETWTRAPLVRRDHDGAITGLRFSNQLMQPLDPCSPDLESFYDAYHLLAKAVADPVNQIEFRSDAGLMQVVHAHRVLHARRGFDGSSGSRHLQDTYFEFDNLRALHALQTGAAR